MVKGFQCKPRPVAAGDLGDGEERAPVVGETVKGGGRKGGLASFERGEIVGGPAGQFAAEFGFDFDVVLVEALRGFPLLGFAERDDDGAVMQGAGELADTSEDGRAEGAKWADGIAFAFATVGASAAFVAGV